MVVRLFLFTPPLIPLLLPLLLLLTLLLLLLLLIPLLLLTAMWGEARHPFCRQPSNVVRRRPATLQLPGEPGLPRGHRVGTAVRAEATADHPADTTVLCRAPGPQGRRPRARIPLRRSRARPPSAAAATTRQAPGQRRHVLSTTTTATDTAGGGPGRETIAVPTRFGAGTIRPP